MMDGAYFTSHTEILDFFNSLLQISLAKIEQTATGAVACQLMDYIFPGSIPLKRVNWWVGLKLKDNLGRAKPL